MKGLFKLFIGVLILVVLVPLLWFLVKELWFFARNMYNGLIASGCNAIDFVWFALFLVGVLLLIFFIKIILD